MENKNKVLMKNNLLVQAKYNLNLVENRVFTTLLYNFQKNKNEIYECKISHEELKSLIKNTNKCTLAGVTSVLESLMSKKITIREMGQIDKWHTSTLIGAVSFDDGIFTIRSLPEIYDLLKDYYETGYTPINMAVLLGMNNYYGQRLYELLRLWSSTKNIINYEVDYIKECLEIKDKYKNFKDFRKRVLEPGVQALNETGYFEIEFKEVKVGRKVHSIDFIVKDLDKRKYFDKRNNFLIEENKKSELNLDENNKENETKDFYIPNKKLFTAKTLESFTNDFKDYDFTDKKLKQLLQEAILVALEKDDEEKIKVKSYNYFKSTLINKINDLKKLDTNVTAPKVKTRFHNISQRYANYEPDELEKLLREGQKSKGIIDEDPIHRQYELAIKEGTAALSVPMLKIVMEYAEKNGLEKPIFKANI